MNPIFMQQQNILMKSTSENWLLKFQSFLDKIPEYLKNSNRIRLDDFAILKLSFSAKGQEEEKNVTSNDITDVRVLFQPCKKLREQLSDVTYTKKKNAAV